MFGWSNNLVLFFKYLCDIDFRNNCTHIVQLQLLFDVFVISQFAYFVNA